MGARPLGCKGTTCSLEDDMKRDDGELQQKQTKELLHT
jgi:hypothetical protein